MSGTGAPTRSALHRRAAPAPRDGLIVLTGRLSNAALRSVARSLPVVVTGRQLKAVNLISLDFDNRAGARLATEHLIGLGHRRIAFIAGDPAHPDSVERQKGYESALRGAGLRVDPRLLLPATSNEQSGVDAVETVARASRALHGDLRGERPDGLRGPSRAVPAPARAGDVLTGRLRRCRWFAVHGARA